MPTESPRIRVLLADDHPVTREGLQLMLERSEEFEVVGPRPGTAWRRAGRLWSLCPTHGWSC